MRCSLYAWFLILLALPSPLLADTIRVLNWEAYLSEDVKSQWEQKTKNQIELIVFDNDETRDAILLNSKHHNVDIAVVDEVIAQRFGQSGKLIAINDSNVPNRQNIKPFWRERCGNYAVPYFWGTLGIVYRSDKVSSPPTSWRDILQPEDHLKGHIGMLNDYIDMLAPALFLEGYSINTDDPAALKKTFNILKAQAPSVLTYEYPITYIQANQKADELYMAVAYGGDQYTLNEKAGEEGLWKYTVPKEGTVLWIDCLAITENSKNKEAALTLLNYLNIPKVAAQNAEDVYAATPNELALSELSEEFKSDLEIFPAKETLQKSELYKKLSNQNVQQRLRISNAIINLHESK